MKLLFVCLGNICRSPIADGIMRDLIAQRGLDWKIDSAGTGGWHVGERPDSRAISIASRYGTDITGLRARKFIEADFDRFDRIYPLDLQNLTDVLALARTENDRARVQLFLEAAFPTRREGVRDPWHEDGLFTPVYQEIREACETLLDRLVKEKNGSG